MKTPIFQRKGYAMKEDTVIALRQPGSFSNDPLTDILRSGARQLLAQAIEAEVAAHISAHADLTDDGGRRRIVRHGHSPEREIQTGIGAVRVQTPRVRDRDPEAPGGRIRFTSSILPPYLRRAKSVEALLPWLYLKGISTGDFGEALAALLGSDAPGLSASTITTNLGANVICRRGAMSTSGPTGCISHRAWITTNNACW
jgi:putative transposase